MFKIRTRVSAIAIVPLLGLLGFAGYSIEENWARLGEVQFLRTEVEVARAVGQVSHELQIERGMSAAFLSSKDAKPDALLSQRAASDKTIATLKTVLASSDLDAGGPDLATKLDAFVKALSGLESLRGEVSARSGSVADLTARYTTTIAAGTDAIAIVERSGAVLDADVARAITTYGALGRGKEGAGRERASVVALLAAEKVPAAGLVKASALAGAQQAEFASVARFVLPQHLQLLESLLSSPANKKLVEMRDAIQAAAETAPPFSGKEWFDAATARINAIHDLQLEIAADADAMAMAVGDSARTALISNIGLALAAALGALGAALLVGRSITRPLGGLTRDMNALAGGDKTVAVAESARTDEIGEMGRAVLVFRNAALELEKAEAEQKRLEAEAAAERRRSEEERALRAEELQQVVNALATGLRNLSDGDLTTRVEAAFAADFEQLRSDFNLAMEKLQAAMQAVTGSAGTINTGADEISRAAADASRRTEQQAASLEETAAALDQITTTVRKTAEGAVQADEVVGGARTQAQQSGQIVHEAVAAMGEIEKSSNQISHIIGVIEEIAFQTNLLALNAGVEAARAGDAGRGFMVVATEVRALAQRSSDAAKEIKTLISASSQQVGRGVQLVGEAGRALEQIVQRVIEIDTLVADIARAANEQADGLSQINTAVNQMDQVTQENAAMVEETTAASQSLSTEAATLAKLIGRFRTADARGSRGRQADVMIAAE